MAISLLCITLFFYLTYVSFCIAEECSILQMNNNYPLITTVKGEMTIALSNRPGYKAVFDKKGNYIQREKLKVDYEAISALIVMESNGKFIIASSNGFENDLNAFDDVNVFDTLSFTSDHMASVTLLQISNENILLGYITIEYKVHLSLYQLDASSRFIQLKEGTPTDSSTAAISCIEMTTSVLALLCLTTRSHNDVLMKMDKDLGSPLIIEVVINQEDLTAVEFNKMIRLEANSFAWCSLKASLVCASGEISDDGIQLHRDKHVVILEESSVKVKSFDVVFHQALGIVLACRYISSDIHYIKLSRVIITKDTLMLQIVKSGDIALESNAVISHLSIGVFGLSFVSLFYHCNANNIYRPIDYPSCEDHRQSVRANQPSIPITIQSKVINRLEEGAEVRFAFTALPTKGSFVFSNGTAIETTQIYVTGEAVFSPVKGDTNQKAEYRGISSRGEGKTCYIEYTIFECFEGCADCSIEGNSESNQCIGNCLTDYYSIIDKPGECRRETNQPSGYYLNKKSSPFIWKHCFSSCEKCLIEEGTESNHNCLECKDKYYKVEFTTNCVQTLPPKHYASTEEGVTIYRRCFDPCLVCTSGLNLNNHNCIECIADYYLLDKTMNCYMSPFDGYYLDKSVSPHKFKRCDSKCLKCQSGSSECTECNGGYYMDSIVNNCIRDCNDFYLETDYCVSQCSSGFGVLLKQCINCKEVSMFNYKGRCIESPPQRTFIADEDTNTIEDCDSSCLTCKGTSSHCLTCESTLFFQQNECVSSCDKSRFVEEEPSKKCINCKSISPSMFKWEDENKCIERLPYSFISNEDYNIIKPCHAYCLTCNKESDETNHNCLSCKETMRIHPRQEGLCVAQCYLPNSSWYIDDSANEFKCTEREDCITAIGQYLINNTLECVVDCKSLSLYEYNSICYSQCPIDSTQNELLMKCFEKLYCKASPIAPSKDTLDLSSVRSSMDALALEYISKHRDVLYQLDWFSLKDCNVRLFKLDECNHNFAYSLQNSAEVLTSLNFAYLNTSECLNKLKVAYNLSSLSDITIIMIDSKQTSAAYHQVDYSAYSSLTGSPFNMSHCKGVINEAFYPISLTADKLCLASDMKLRGVDLFNPVDPFFNNHCSYYFIQQGRDVIIKDRRSDFFFNVTLCEPGCLQVAIDYSNAKADCLCEMKTEVNEKTKEYEWLSFLTNKAGSNVMACFSYVFTMENFAQNYGSWIFLILIATSLSALFVFFFKDVGHLCSFIDSSYFDGIGGNPHHNALNKAKSPSKSKRAKTKAHKTKPRNSGEEQGQENELPSAKSTTKIVSKDTGRNDLGINNISELCQIEMNNQPELSLKQKPATREYQPVKESPDDLLFIEAIEKDKRPFYCLFFNYSTRLLFGLNLCTNYSIFEPISLKLASTSLYLSFILILNIFQYSESYISTRYHSETELIVDEIIQSSVVGLICLVLGLVITYSFSYRKRFITLQRLKTASPHKFLEEKDKALFKFKGAVGAILVVNVILTGFFWYYVSAFCSVYHQTKIRWLICSAMSLGVSIAFQTVLAIVVSVLRLISIKHRSRCCYSISQLLL